MALLYVMLQFHVILYIPQLYFRCVLFTFFVYWYCFEVIWLC